MQRFGIGKWDEIKKNFKMFQEIQTSAISSRAYSLLCCSSFITFEKIKCNPFKIRAYFQKLIAEIREAQVEVKTKLKFGRFVNSYPIHDPELQKSDLIFAHTHFRAEYLDDEKADIILYRSGLYDLELNVHLIVRSNDPRIHQVWVDMHEIH